MPFGAQTTNWAIWPSQWRMKLLWETPFKHHQKQNEIQLVLKTAILVLWATVIISLGKGEGGGSVPSFEKLHLQTVL